MIAWYNINNIKNITIIIMIIFEFCFWLKLRQYELIIFKIWKPKFFTVIGLTDVFFWKCYFNEFKSKFKRAIFELLKCIPILRILTILVLKNDQTKI